MKKNIFVIALDEFNRDLFDDLRNNTNYTYHPLFPPDEIVAAANYSMSDLLEEARESFRTFEGHVDAVVSYWDFPATLMLPTLRRMAGLETTTTESILRCVHKYWSRVVQQEVVPDMVPRFAAFDPGADDPLANIDLDFPFWVKPVKAHSSILGFRIENADDFHAVLPKIRERIGRFSAPFNYLFERAEVPTEIASIDGSYCIAEEMISTEHQCTLEGYVYNGEPEVYGIVDSVHGKDRSSLERYNYPSRLPDDVQQRMIDATIPVMRQTGLDNEPFNIEFFHDPETGHISLLEINPRISKSHCPLFHYVEGTSHQEVMVEVALGVEPRFPHGEGQYPMATKYMVRRFEGDAVVRRVPTGEEIRAMQEQVDGVMVMLWVDEGDRLSDFEDQDSYSFEYANLFIGGSSEEDLQKKYDRAMNLLPFEFEPVNEPE